MSRFIPRPGREEPDGRPGTLQLWMLGKTAHVRDSAGSKCILSSGTEIASCSRWYNPVDKATAGFVSVSTALASRVVGSTKPVRAVATESTATAVSTATVVYELRPGEQLQLITASADNMMTGNAHDPTADAASLALATDPSTIASASGAFWNNFWDSSLVKLPSRPALEQMWFGSLYTTAISTAGARSVARTSGRLPPPGLYGPFASGDFCFWNGTHPPRRCFSPLASLLALSLVQVALLAPKKP